MLVNISDTKQLSVEAVHVYCSTKRFPGSIGSSAQILDCAGAKDGALTKALGCVTSSKDRLI